jgi:hypothetical protein
MQECIDVTFTKIYNSEPHSYYVQYVHENLMWLIYALAQQWNYKFNDHQLGPQELPSMP